MNKIPCLLAALLGIACVASAFAQTAQPYGSSTPKTRAEVRAELDEWLAAGYQLIDRVHYPDNALRTSAIVAQRRAADAGR
jgi:hypothetical protein